MTCFLNKYLLIIHCGKYYQQIDELNLPLYLLSNLLMYLFKADVLSWFILLVSVSKLKFVLISQIFHFTWQI